MSQQPAPYTTYASSVVMMTEVVKTRMSSKPVGSKRPRKLSIQEPSGPSTQGGRNSRQSLLLVTEGESAVCGWIDFIGKQMELKDYQTMALAYELRYSKKFDVTSEEYAIFVENLTSVLGEFAVPVTLGGFDESSAEVAAAAPVATEGHSSTGKILVIAGLSLVVGVALTVIVMILVRG